MSSILAIEAAKLEAVKLGMTIADVVNTVGKITKERDELRDQLAVVQRERDELRLALAKAVIA